MRETPSDKTLLAPRHQVKVLFVRNLASTVTEEILEKAFSQFGKLERVKKLKDYAFIHFEERDGAVKVRTHHHHFPTVEAGGSRWEKFKLLSFFGHFCRLSLI